MALSPEVAIGPEFENVTVPAEPPPVLDPPTIVLSKPILLPTEMSPVMPSVPPPPPIDWAINPTEPAPTVIVGLVLTVESMLPSPEMLPVPPTCKVIPPAPVVRGSGTESAPLPPPAPIA